MPHCVVEYSSNVPDEPDWRRVMADVHAALMSSGEFDLADIKSRVVRHDAFLIGDGADGRTFVTLTVQMMSGRDDDTKARIAEAALGVLERAFPRALAETRASLTVQITDIHRASYRRRASAPRESS